MAKKSSFMLIKGIISKFTILDILVVVVAVGIIAYLFTKRVTQKTEWVDVRVKLGASEWWWDTSNPDYWFVEDLKAGEKAYSSLGEQVAQMNKIEIFDDSFGKKVVFVNLALTASHDAEKGLYIFNYQPLQVGKPIDLTFSGGNVRGLVVKIGNIENKYLMKKVEMRVEGVLADVVQTYKTGLELRDNNNDLVAVIESIKSEDSRTLQLIDVKNKRIMLTNSSLYRKDVTLQMQLKTFESGRETYFVNGQSLKVGQLMNIYFPTTTIEDGRITKIF